MGSGGSVDMLQGLQSFDKDKLDAEAEKNRPPTRWERKMNRIFGEAKHIRKSFTMGFLMGGCVGAMMGGLTGCYFAFQYR